MGLFSRREKPQLQSRHGEAEAYANRGFEAQQAGDLDAAVGWYTKAADLGETSAMSNLGMIYGQRGENEISRQWFIRGAEAGNPGAMLNLGISFGITKEFGAARRWFVKAESLGEGRARRYIDDLDAKSQSFAVLGQMKYDEGDREEARHHWLASADLENVDAMNGLGRLAYEAGDFDEALEWWGQAAALGDGNAAQLCRHLREGIEKGYTDLWNSRS